MHSLSMAQNILETALEEAKKYEAKRIMNISVEVGGEDFVESDSLQFCPQATAEGTIAEGAQIEIELAAANEPQQIALELD